MFGFLSVTIEEFPFHVSHPFLKFLILGGIGSYVFAGITSGVFLFAAFIKRSSKTVKVLSCVLFFITYPSIVFCGIFTLIPYGIYNIIKLVKIMKREKDNPPPIEKIGEKKRNTFPYKSTIGLFKSSIIAYICGCVVSIVLPVCLFSFSVSEVNGVRTVTPLFEFGIIVGDGLFNAPLIFIMCIVLLTMFMGLIIIIINFEFRKTFRILYEDCNANEYIAIYNKFANFNLRLRDKAVIYCNLSTGLIAKGDFAEAIEILEKIDIENKRIVKKCKLVYYNNLTAAYLFSNNFEKAKKCLEMIKNLKYFWNKNTKLQSFYNEVLEFATARFNLVANRDTSGLQYFKDTFDKKQDLYSKVMIKYLLSILYENLGDKTNTGDCRRYVVENGKDLFCAKQLT